MKMLHYRFAILPMIELYMTTHLKSTNINCARRHFGSNCLVWDPVQLMLVPYDRIELPPTDYETVILPLNQ